MTLSKQTPDVDPPELRVPSDTLAFIIERAREFTVKAGSSDPNPSVLDDQDVDAAVLEDRPSDPVQQELMSYLSDLSDGAQIDLVALMWMGRADGPSDWAEAQQIAAQEHNDHTPAYLCGTPLLASYLEDGLEAIGRSPDGSL